MKNTLETRLGIFFALALIAAFLIMEMIGSFDFFKRGIRVHARFNTVQELKEGDPVKMAGVQVGRPQGRRPRVGSLTARTASCRVRAARAVSSVPSSPVSAA